MDYILIWLGTNVSIFIVVRVPPPSLLSPRLCSLCCYVL